MKKFRIICLLACLALIGLHIYEINYKDLSLSANKNHYLGIASMSMIGLLFLMQILKDGKKN